MYEEIEELESELKEYKKQLVSIQNDLEVTLSIDQHIYQQVKNKVDNINSQSPYSKSFQIKEDLLKKYKAFLERYKHLYD
jgi:hypothetical protein